jgi:hypothetical protein
MGGSHAAIDSGFINYSLINGFFYRKTLQTACSLKNYKWKENFTGFMRTFNIVSV